MGSVEASGRSGAELPCACEDEAKAVGRGALLLIWNSWLESPKRSLSPTLSCPTISLPQPPVFPDVRFRGQMLWCSDKGAARAERSWTCVGLFAGIRFFPITVPFFDPRSVTSTRPSSAGYAHWRERARYRCLPVNCESSPRSSVPVTLISACFRERDECSIGI